MNKAARPGLTLLEVILALAILGGAIAVISQASWSGLENARRTRDFVRAELLAENLMSEMLIGARPLEAAPETAFDEEQCPDEADRWTFSIEVSPAAVSGLLTICVTVREKTDLPHGVEFSLLRWTLDPNTETSESE